MGSHVQFEESLRDTPLFRQQVAIAEGSIGALEQQLTRVIKNGSAMLEKGHTFAAASRTFLDSLKSVLSDPLVLADNKESQEGLLRMVNTFEAIEDFRAVLLEQIQLIFVNPLKQKISIEIAALKEAGARYYKMRDDMEATVSKFMATSKNRNIEEIQGLVQASHAAYTHNSLDYALQLNTFQAHQRYDIGEKVVALVHANSSFLKQGLDELKGLEGITTTETSEIQTLVTELKLQTKQMEAQHSEAQLVKPCLVNTRNGVTDGYLYRKNGSSWVRDFVRIQQGQITCAIPKTAQFASITDIRLCMVKKDSMEAVDRRNCFDLVTPNRVFVLQAESADDKKLWIAVIQNEVEQQLSSSDFEKQISKSVPPASHSPDVQRKRILSIYAVPGNNVCADCSAPDPEWCSINLGVTICIECSGIHRGLGTHVSKVRSLHLDHFEPETTQLLLALGNQMVNAIYEHAEKTVLLKPQPSSNRSEKESFILSKYVDKVFQEINTTDALDEGLVLACSNNKLLQVYEYIARGANVSYSDARGNTPLSATMTEPQQNVRELLLINNASLLPTQIESGSIFHFAVRNHNTAALVQLLRRNPDLSTLDGRGKTALDLANELGDKEMADILTKAATQSNPKASEGGSSQELLSVPPATKPRASSFRLSPLFGRKSSN